MSRFDRKLGEVPADVQQQLAASQKQSRPATKPSKPAKPPADPLDTPGIMEPWMQYGVSRKDYPKIPDRVETLAKMGWVVANFAVRDLDLHTAPCYESITDLRECRRNPAFWLKYHAKYTDLRQKREAEAHARQTDDGRDLSETYQKLADLKRKALIDARWA